MVEKSNSGISTLYVAIGMIGLLIVGFVAGYYVNAAPPDSQEFPEDSAWRSASINLSGSTTVQPIASAAAIEFMNMYSGTTVTVSGGGSGRGYSDIISGVVNIGMASRPPKKTEIENKEEVDLWLHPIALDAVCVVVNPSVASSLNLTSQEVARIFSSDHTWWDEVKTDLPHEKINVFVREDGSGTRGTFDEYMEKALEGYAVDPSKVTEKTSNPAIRTAVESTPYSIGYVGFGFLAENMVAVSLYSEDEGQYIYPTLENIGSGKYPISRYLYFVTSSQPVSGSIADRFTDFVLSPDGQQIVVDQGFLELPANYNYPES
jgi:phosphate transport system substrate-binding protein